MGAAWGVVGDACVGCARPLEAGSRFCPACGTPQPEHRPVVAPAAERRRLTILFCDLVGSTALSERLDPEELGDLVLAYQELGRSVVTGFGGHVAQFLGDGLLAYFGYPVAHEDDAERAVLAGRSILARLGEVNEAAARHGAHLEARVGIHAGPAVVGAMGSADRSDTSAFGSTPNVAARLEGIAAPGTVVISDEVRRSLDGRFTVVDRGTPELKGISRPIRVWEVADVGERAPRLPTRSTTAMVGRADELQVLLDAAAAADAGTATHVLVAAEPGVGKTRLLQELYEERDRRGLPTRWFEGRCSELTSATPLAPVVGFLRRALGLEGVADPEDQHRRLAEGLAPMGSEGAAAARYLGELLGISAAVVDEGPELRRRRTLDALVAWLRALARVETVVVVVEDLHWSDPTTLDLLELLASEGGASRLCCVHTHRPEVQPFAESDRFGRLALAHLGAAEAQELAQRLGAGHGVPADVLEALAARSDGVPLFLEELVAALGDPTAEGEDRTVPLTLHALLASRLDQLGPARSIAQAAAVIGREFSPTLVAAITGQPEADLDRLLDQLAAAGIIARRPSEAGPTLAFRHALIQDAAYASLLQRDRRRLHAALAVELTGPFADLVAEAPEVVAHHYAAADDGLRAGGWYERAGRRAAERAALAEARAHFETGIQVVDGLGPSPDRTRLVLSLHILLGNTLMGGSGLSADEAAPVWARAITAAEEIGDDEELTAALNGLAVLHSERGELVVAEERAQQVLDVAERTGSRVASLRGHGTLGLIRLYQSSGTEAHEHLVTARALARPDDFFTVTYGIGHDEETTFHLIASWTSCWLGRPDEGLRTALDGVAVAARIPSSLSQAMARHAVTMAHHLRGEPEAAAAVAREGAAIATELGFPFWADAADMLFGTQLARLGDPAGAERIEGALERVAGEGRQGGGSMVFSWLAEAYLGVGRYEDVLGAVDLGLALGELVGQTFCDTELVGARGRALLAMGRRAEARTALEESLATGRRQGAALAALHSTVALAPLLAADEGAVSARALLSAGLAAMGDGHDTVDQCEARAQLAALADAT